MTIGIIWALVAGLMLGLYALPGKFTKGFKEESTWGLFFMLTMFFVPVIATATFLKGTGGIYADPEVKAVLPVTIISSVLWGIGVMMWGKAIHHIGLGEVKAGEHVIVIGGEPIGTLIAPVAMDKGAKVLVSEVNANRVEFTKNLGIDAVNSAKEDLLEFVTHWSGGAMADVVFEASGSAKAVEIMTEISRAPAAASSWWPSTRRTSHHQSIPIGNYPIRL